MLLRELLERIKRQAGKHPVRHKTTYTYAVIMRQPVEQAHTSHHVLSKPDNRVAVDGYRYHPQPRRAVVFD